MKLAVMWAAAALVCIRLPDWPAGGRDGGSRGGDLRALPRRRQWRGQGGDRFPAGMTYTPGVKQQLTITITDADAQRFGFQLSARLAGDNSQAGTLAPAPGESKSK